MEKFKFLVTGGAGYIGSHVTNLLLDNGHSVTVLDSLVTGNKQLVPKKAKLEICDIADTKKILKIFKKEKFHLVFHFAGLIRVEESVKYPKKYYDNNYEKAKIFLDTCIENNLNRIIFSSTAAVYGNSKNSIVSEKDILNPISPYADSKFKFENYLIEKHDENKVNFILLRYFNVAGADEKLRTGLISKKATHLIKIASEVATGKREKLIINGSDYNTKDGTTVRDYIHVSDLAEIHLITALNLIKNNKSDIYNCGYGKGYSVKDVINQMNKLITKNMNVEVGPRRSGDLDYLVANVLKFKKNFSWKPKFDNLEYILRTSLNWEKKLN